MRNSDNDQSLVIQEGILGNHPYNQAQQTTMTCQRMEGGHVCTFETALHLRAIVVVSLIQIMVLN
jgi:hypothetical protein